MSVISILWLVLLGLREGMSIFTDRTTLVTVAILALQFLNLFLLMQQQGWKCTVYHLILLALFPMVLYNPITLKMVNIAFAVILLKDVPIKRIALLSAIAMLLILFVYLAAFNLGFIHDKTIVSHKGGNAHFLGFRNTNNPGMAYLRLVLVVTVCWLIFFRLKLPIYLALIPNYCIYALTKGRTSFYIVCFYFLCLFYFSFPFRYRLSRKFVLIAPFVLYVATFVLCIIWLQFPLLNKLFSSRFRINAGSIQALTPINVLVGYKMPPDTPLDSAFLAQLFKGGIVSVFLFLSVYVKGCVRMRLHDLRLFFPFIISLVVSGFAEDTFANANLSTILFYKILIDQFEFKNLRSRYIFRPFGAAESSKEIHYA